MIEPRILLVRITAEMPRFYEYYDSLDQLIKPPNTSIYPVHSSSPAKNRNIAIKVALKMNSFTHLFFTDDDHVYPPDTLMRLLAREVDIVSGTYCMKFPPFPIIALNNPNKKDMSAFIKMDNVGPAEMIKIPRVPAGCLLVTTSCLKKMKYPWFTLGQIQKDEWGDDLWFSDRANEAGIDVHMDASVRVGHITKCILTPKYVNGEWIIEHFINSNEAIEVMGSLDLLSD